MSDPNFRANVRHIKDERNKKAAAAIRRQEGGLRGVKGEISCPSCGGRLQYTIVAQSGRIRASCDKKGCTNFEE